MAPRAGFEPATIRLTVECSTAELPRNRAKQAFARGQRITKPSTLAKDEMAGSGAVSISGRNYLDHKGLLAVARLRDGLAKRRSAHVTVLRNAAKSTYSVMSLCRAGVFVPEGDSMPDIQT